MCVTCDILLSCLERTQLANNQFALYAKRKGKTIKQYCKLYCDCINVLDKYINVFSCFLYVLLIYVFLSYFNFFHQIFIHSYI